MIDCTWPHTWAAETTQKSSQGKRKKKKKSTCKTGHQSSANVAGSSLPELRLGLNLNVTVSVVLLKLDAVLRA